MCFDRWIGGGEHGQGGKFLDGSQNRRVGALAAERAYKFIVIGECTSDITNLREIQDRNVRVYLAGQSSLNTLKVLEDVLALNPSIKRAIILPRPPRRDDRHLQHLAQLGTRELVKALPDSRFATKIFLGDFTSLQPNTVDQERVIFGDGDGVHLMTLAGRNLLTSAVIRSLQPLIDYV